MLEIDTVRAAMQDVCWYPGDELSDEYLALVDAATTPQLGEKGHPRAVRALIELTKPNNDTFIRDQLARYEFPPHIEGLEEAYDSTVAQSRKLLGL